MINLLSIITNEGQEEKIKKLFKKHNLIFTVTLKAEGTASESLLNYWGLTPATKQIFVTLINKSIEYRLLKEINKTLELKKHGMGICFTIPLSGANKFVDDLLIEYKETKDMEIKDKYHLIITSVLEGYSETVINAAKKGGASGGTVINGRSLGTETENFLKMKIEPEKDIVLIIAPEYKKNNIMHSITQKSGIKTEAKGVCLSIPIDSIIGINH